MQRYGDAFHGSAMQLAESSALEHRSSCRCWLLAPQRQILLTAGENLVGRDPGVQVWLDSASVSRRHARITVEGGRVTLEDLQSKNGTRVCGSRISAPRPLADGDEVRFGIDRSHAANLGGRRRDASESDH